MQTLSKKHDAKEISPREMQYYRGKAVVELRIVYTDPLNMQQAVEAVMYHFELLQPEIRVKDNLLVIRMQPLDPSLFGWQEGLDILRRTLAQSLPDTCTADFSLFRS